MQRGLILLICATFLRSTYLTNASEQAPSYDADEEDFVLIDENEPEFAIPGVTNFQSITAATVPRPALAPHFTNDSLVANENAYARDRVGLSNGNNLCYMNAFISSVFNIHRFREALYCSEPENASTVLLGEVFARLQTSTTPVRTSMTLIPALKKEINWTFGNFECILEFIENIIEILPQSVNSLFQLSIRNDIYLTSSDTIISSKEVLEPFFIVPPNLPSLADAVLNHFADNDPTNTFIIEQDEYEAYRDLVSPFEGKNISVPVYRKHVIANRPEMMIFGIRRRNLLHVDNTKMILNLNMTFPGLEEGSSPVKYHLHAFCYYTPGHYISYVRDFSSGNPAGNWYKYNDSVVTAVRTVRDYNELEAAAFHAATLAFYVREDSVMANRDHEVSIPERIMTIAKLISSLEETKAIIPPSNDIKRSPPTMSPKNSPSSANFSATLIKESLSLKSSEEKPRDQNLPPLTDSAFRKAFPMDSANYHFDSDIPVEEA